MMSVSDLMADTCLDPSIEFSHPSSSSLTQPKAIFLTGATGFLGAWLLAGLLQKTDATVYCLVRADNAEQGKARLKQQLQFYALWQESVGARIIPVIGDLSKPRLALSESHFTGLASKIDVIYHSGAQVNAMYSYERLKDSNVLGTQEILRLAGLKRTKAVHFISTLAVFFSDRYCGNVVYESDIVEIDVGLKGGYKQSKWVAEALVKEAQQRGLPATIYRLGRVLGDQKNGIMTKFGDLLCNLLQGGIHLEAFPTIQTQLNVIPVDYVSQAIIHLSQQAHSFGKAFHLSNPQSISWQALWKIVVASGYPLQEINYQQWVDKINHRAKTQRKNPLYLVLQHLLRSPIYMFSEKPHCNVQQTQTELVKAALNCPPVDKKLLGTYLRYFQNNNDIPLPKNRNTHGVKSSTT